jgi:hypothetical protein
MKKLFLFLWYFSSISWAFGQADILQSSIQQFNHKCKQAAKQKSVRKSIREFGAKGDGKTNDTWAFLRASNYLKALKNSNYRVELFIPKGIYLIGMQAKRDNPLKHEDLVIQTPSYEAYYGPILIDLNGCQNVSIVGEEGSKIKYVNGLKFGSFDAKTGKPYFPEKLPFNNSYYAASIGVLLFIHNAKNIEVRNLELDGNIQGAEIGGNWGDLGIQLGHIGTYISGICDNILVQNVHCHHFGLDGFAVRSKDTMNNSLKIVLNCKSSWNGRQGLSWTGGNNLRCFKTTFSETGQSVISTAPGAGLDIEPESGGGASCVNGYFESCIFQNNKSFGILATSTASDRISRGHVFKQCVLIGTQSPALKSPASHSRFENCYFLGALVTPNGRNLEALVFKQCYFTDVPELFMQQLPPSLRAKITKIDTYVPPYCLVDLSWGKGSTLFESCRFDIQQSIGMMLDGGPYCILRNSQVNFRYLAQFLSSRPNISFMHDCVLESNRFVNLTANRRLNIMSNGKIKSNKKNTRSGEITVGSNNTGNDF